MQPSLQPAAIGLDHVVAELRADMSRRRLQLLDQASVHRCSVRADLHRRRPAAPGAGEELPSSHCVPGGPRRAHHLLLSPSATRGNAVRAARRAIRRSIRRSAPVKPIMSGTSSTVDLSRQSATAAEEARLNAHAPSTFQPPPSRERCIRVCTQRARPAARVAPGGWHCPQPTRMRTSTGGRQDVNVRPAVARHQVRLRTTVDAGLRRRGGSSQPGGKALRYAPALILLRSYRRVTNR